MTLIMTSERCPECNQIIYMRLARKDTSNELHIADGCYLDQNGIMTIATFDEATITPDYCCIHCGWFV